MHFRRPCRGHLISGSCAEHSAGVQLIITLPFALWAYLMPQRVKNSPKAEDAGLIPGSAIFPGEGNVTQSSIVAWRISPTEEPGRIQSRGSLKCRDELATKQQQLGAEADRASSFLQMHRSTPPLQVSPCSPTSQPPLWDSASQVSRRRRTAPSRGVISLRGLWRLFSDQWNLQDQGCH